MVTTAPRLACAFVSALSLCGCASSTQSPATSDRPAIVGVWFKGLYMYRADDEPEVFGLVFRSQIGVPSSDQDALQLMGEAEIVDRFRSAREAWIAMERSTREHRGPVTWIRAEYGPKWLFSNQEPPDSDVLEVSGTNDVPIGGDAVAFHRAYTNEVFVFPPPLQKRGIAVCQVWGKANARPYFVPRDFTTSMTTSWDELERGMSFLHDDELINTWQDGRRTVFAWAERHALKGPVRVGPPPTPRLPEDAATVHP